MKTAWASGLSNQKKQEVRAEFIGSPSLRHRLKEIIDGKVESTRKYARSQKCFEDPNWDRRVAHGLGYEAALYEILSLIEE